MNSFPAVASSSSPPSSPAPVPRRATTLAHDVFRRAPHALDPFFRPRSVAVVGATEAPNAVGRTLLQNLLATSFGGAVYPVNLRRPTVLGHKAYRSVRDIEAPVDLAVIATPAAAVPAVIADCAARGCRNAVVISAGFREVGPAGAALEAAILDEARRGGVRVVGPNCLGVMSPPDGLNATFAAGMARPGSVAFLSQSGALLTAILDWSVREQVGFSAFVSVGSMLDVGWGDLIDYLGDDPRTRAIVLYMESIGDARAFLSAAREVALTKPIIVIKAGRSEAASRAAASHTGALTGSDEVLDAAFRRCGVLRVNDISEVFDLADVLGKQPRPRGPRLSIVTNAGGPAVLATDALIAAGGALGTLSADTLGRLDAILPTAWSHANPIDILGDADPDRYAGALATAAADPGSDGLLAILTPQDMTDPTRTAEALAAYAHIEGKPVLASWMGGDRVASGIDILNRAGIPTFQFPDDAARTFCHMWRYAEDLRGLYQTPARLDADARGDVARSILDDAERQGRTLLDEHESKLILASYGIPTVATSVARDEAEALGAAQALGFPVVLKVWSRVITHKSDVGGVKLQLADAAAVAQAFREIERAVVAKAGRDAFLGVTVQPSIDRSRGIELILGSTVDPQVGPVLLFGAGGELVEVLRDHAIGLPPLTTTLASRLMERTKIHRALAGVRGRPPVNLNRLATVLVRFSALVVDQPRIREIDVNPLLVSADGPLALDGRIVLHTPPGTGAATPARPAIRPYPSEYVYPVRLTDGESVVIRPIRPEDEPAMVAFHRTLGEDTVHQRYMHTLKLDQRTAHDRLVRVCFIDYEREMALVVERRGPAGAREIVAVGRLSRDRGGRTSAEAGQAEFSLLVSDSWQGRGVGRALLRRLIEIGRCEGLTAIYADILPSNLRMQRLCASLGFGMDGGIIDGDPDGDVVRATCRL